MCQENFAQTFTTLSIRPLHPTICDCQLVKLALGEVTSSGAGRHRIEMRYHPKSVLLGAIMTAAGLLGALVFRIST